MMPKILLEQSQSFVFFNFEEMQVFLKDLPENLLLLNIQKEEYKTERETQNSWILTLVTEGGSNE